VACVVQIWMRAQEVDDLGVSLPGLQEQRVHLRRIGAMHRPNGIGAQPNQLSRSRQRSFSGGVLPIELGSNPVLDDLEVAHSPASVDGVWAARYSSRDRNRPPAMSRISSR